MKKLLLLLSLGVFLFSCGSDDDNDGMDNGGVTPTSIEGKWTVDKIELDVVAESETTINYIKSDLNYTKAYLNLEYIPLEKSYEFDYYTKDKGTSGGEAWFSNNILTTVHGDIIKFELINGRFYKEYDYVESYKAEYPDVQKAVQKIWFKK